MSRVIAEAHDEEDTGQGRIASAHRQKLIEDYAQAVITEYLEEDGYDVTDTREGHPYDCVAVRDETKLFVERKGTQSAEPTVLVTIGEVEHARAHPGHCALGIVTKIEVDGDGAAGGEY